MGHNNSKYIDAQRVYDAFKQVFRRWVKAYSDQRLSHKQWVRGVVEVERRMHKEYLIKEMEVAGGLKSDPATKIAEKVQTEDVTMTSNLSQFTDKKVKAEPQSQKDK